MTCLKDEGLDGPGMKSHTYMLGTFFVYSTLALSMPIFKKKSPLKRLRAKVYTKNVLNIEVCDFIPGPSRPSPFKQVIVVLYL